VAREADEAASEGQALLQLEVNGLQKAVEKMTSKY